MDRFYIGLPMRIHARYFYRCCMHVDRLKKRKMPLGCIELLLDSHAFNIIRLFGDYPDSPETYAGHVHRIAKLVPKITAVTQDYMCEPFMLAITKKTIPEHQALTIDRFDRIRAALDPDIYLMPVLQGYQPHEYVDHLRQYGSRIGVNSWVGVGSVCKRNGNPKKIFEIMYGIKRERPDIRLHGFGIKSTSVADPDVRRVLWSSDSMAWSLAAFHRGGDKNDWREAERFRRQIERYIRSDKPC